MLSRFQKESFRTHSVKFVRLVGLASFVVLSCTFQGLAAQGGGSGGDFPGQRRGAGTHIIFR